ncbi:MAG: hypothetical protein A2Y15_01005 [Clostridiales bacterium GWF2_36_10]|nr:MAG: hypothetical protein A2Y15_01005 [Clostridiales bacterium GWF2_36_10]HAN20562.1 hypothetical protein [Clostridiales bacterium]
MNLKTLMKSKKIRYGSLSVVFIVVFVAVILIANVILSSIASKTNLTIDLTKEELYSVSNESKTILETLGDDLDITIYFLADRDLYEVSAHSRMVRDLGEQYAEVLPGKIKVEYKNITQDPGFVDEYLDETQTTLTPDNVIVKGKYHHRILTLKAFFTTSSETQEVIGFYGEQRFTAAMLQSSMSEPQVVTFTTGHSETTSETLLSIFDAAEFEIQVKNLAYEEIDERTRILIISNPKEDFQGYNGANAEVITEIDKITTFVEKFNNLIVFVDSTTKELPNLQEYLLDYWGLGYKPFHKLIDTKHSVAKGGAEGYSIVGQYVTTGEETAADTIHKVASSTGSGATTVYRNAVEIYSDVNQARKNIVIETVMETFDTAEVVYTDENQQVVSEDGIYPLMLLSTLMDYGDNNTKLYQYVLLVSSTDFAKDDFLTNEFGNRKLMFGAARIMGTERVSPDIDYKPFKDPAMTIELGAANFLAWMVSAIFPIIIITIGLVVFFKRRHL